MPDCSISELMRCQQALWERHRDTWAPMEPAYARDFLLWLVEELGESIAIIKKKGDKAIMEQAEARAAFLEEMSDVLMYYLDTLLRYGVSAQELSDAFLQKHAKNMGRDYAAEYARKYTASQKETACKSEK